MGWTLLLVGEEHGGGSVSGRGAVDLALIGYEFGRHAAPGPLVDCNVIARALSGQGGDLHRAVLAELIAGTAIAACCLGAAPWQNPDQTTVRIQRDGGDVLIDGTVRPVESARQAGYLLVTGMSVERADSSTYPLNGAGYCPGRAQRNRRHTALRIHYLHQGARSDQRPRRRLRAGGRSGLGSGSAGRGHCVRRGRWRDGRRLRYDGRLGL